MNTRNTKSICANGLTEKFHYKNYILVIKKPMDMKKHLWH